MSLELTFLTFATWNCMKLDFLSLFWVDRLDDERLERGLVESDPLTTDSCEAK